MTVPIKSPHVRTNLAFTRAGFEAGRKMAVRTHDWMERNEAAFSAIFCYVKRLREMGQKGRVRDRVASMCVNNGISVGDEYAFNNDFWSGVARYMVLVDPSLEGNPIYLRDSAIDMYGLLPVSWLDLPTEEEKPIRAEVV